MKITSKRLEKLGFYEGHRGNMTLGTISTENYHWYGGMGINIKYTKEGFKIWTSEMQSGVLLGHVRLSTIKDIIKNDKV